MKHSKIFIATIATLTLSLAQIAYAQSPIQPKSGAINLKMNSFKEVVTTDKNGIKKINLEPINSAVPGDKITYITEYKNVSNKRVDSGAVISNSVPNNTHYVAGSAYCDNCTILFSVDGKRFGKLANLNISLGNGKSRPANNMDIKKVRWVINSSLVPQAQGTVGYKAQINKNTLTKN